MEGGESISLLMKPVEGIVTIERALELTGYGKYTFFFTLICGLCLCGATAEVYSVGFILPAAECDLNLDTDSKSLLAGAAMMGMILSANIWGFLSDRYGRKKIIIYSGMCGVFCSFVALLSQGFWTFVVFKCLAGASVTGSLSIMFAYSGEFLPEKYRSKSIIFIGILQNLSSIYIPALAWLLLPLDYSLTIFGCEYNTWRIFLLVNALPLLFGTLAIFLFPESPKYLLSSGDLDGTVEVLKRIYVGNNVGKAEDFPVKKILPESRDEKKTSNVLKDQLALIFKEKYRLNVLCTSYLQFGNFAVSSGMLIWYVDILNIQSGDQRDLTVCEAIQNGKNSTSNCDNTFNSAIFTQNLWIGLLYIIGNLLIIFILNYFKKTILQGILAIVAGICAIIMMFVTSGILINILFVIFLVLPGLCILIVNALVVDLFPTHMRSSAISFTLTMGRISSLITTSIVGYLIQFNCHLTFSIYALLMISSAFIAVLMRSRDKPLLSRMIQV